MQSLKNLEIVEAKCLKWPFKTHFGPKEQKSANAFHILHAVGLEVDSAFAINNNNKKTRNQAMYLLFWDHKLGY